MSRETASRGTRVDRFKKMSPERTVNRAPWLCLALAVTMTAGPSSVRAGVEVTHPYDGVTLLVRSESSPRNVTMHVVEVDLTTPGIRFRLTPRAGNLETLRQSTLDFLVQQNAQVAVNAHFFLPYLTPEPDANVVGFAASDGDVYSGFEPQPVAPGYADQSYAIVPYAPALNVDRFNRASIIHWDPAAADGKHASEPVEIGNAVAGSAQIVTDGEVTIPVYSGLPGGLNPIYGYAGTNSWYEMPRARTAIGVTRDRSTLFLFTVDHAGESEGLTVREVAQLLIGDYQVFNAINLDGGPSTTLVMQDPETRAARLINNPVAGAPGDFVGSNFAVFAAPAPERPGLRAAFLPGAASLVISWPGILGDWHLQEASDLRLADWAPVADTPQVVGDRVRVIRPPGSGARFYRLSR